MARGDYALDGQAEEASATIAGREAGLRAMRAQVPSPPPPAGSQEAQERARAESAAQAAEDRAETRRPEPKGLGDLLAKMRTQQPVNDPAPPVTINTEGWDPALLRAAAAGQARLARQDEERRAKAAKEKAERGKATKRRRPRPAGVGQRASRG